MFGSNARHKRHFAANFACTSPQSLTERRGEKPCAMIEHDGVSIASGETAGLRQLIQLSLKVGGVAEAIQIDVLEEAMRGGPAADGINADFNGNARLAVNA